MNEIFTPQVFFIFVVLALGVLAFWKWRKPSKKPKSLTPEDKHGPSA